MSTEQISLDINIDKDGSAVKSAGKVSTSIREIGNEALSTHNNLALLKKGFYAIGGVYLFTKLVKGAHEYEKAVREVNTLIKDSSHDIESLRRGIDQMTVAFGQKPRDTVKATYQIISAGARGNIQTLERLRVAGQLAVGGVTTYAQAADLLTTVVNAYSSSTLTAIQMSDILFTTVRLGKTTVRELAASMGTAAGMASQAGISFGDLNAMIATMTLSTPSTPRVLTQIRSMINNILNPRDQALVIAKRLKFDFSIEGIEDKGSITRWLDEFIEKTGGSIELASNFFTIRGLAGFIGLLNNWEKFNEIQKETASNFEGATLAAFEKVNQQTQVLAQGSALLAREMNKAGDVLIAVFAPALEQIILHYDEFKNTILGTLVFIKFWYAMEELFEAVAFKIILAAATYLAWKLVVKQMILTAIAFLRASYAGRVLVATLEIMRRAFILWTAFMYLYIPLLMFASAVIAVGLAWWYFGDKITPLKDHAATIGDIAAVAFNLGNVRNYANELEELNTALDESGRTPAEKWLTEKESRWERINYRDKIFGVATPDEIKKSYRKLDDLRKKQAEVGTQKIKEVLSLGIVPDQSSDIQLRDSFFDKFNAKIQKTALDGSSFFDDLGKSINNAALSGYSLFGSLGEYIKNGFGSALSFFISDAQGADKIPSNESVQKFGPESPEPPTWTDNHIIDYFQDQWDEAWSEISGQNAARVKDARVFAEQFGPESPEPPTWTDNHIIDYFQDQWDEAWSEISGQNAARVKDARVFAEQFGPESPEPPTWTDNHIIDYFQDQWDEAWSEISGQNAARVKDARVFAEQFGPESPEPPTWTDNHIIDYFQDQWDEAWSEISGQNAARVKDARVFAEQFGPESPEPPTWTDNHIIDYFQDASKSLNNALGEAVSFFISDAHGADKIPSNESVQKFGPDGHKTPTWTDNHIIDYFQDQWDEAWSEISGQNAARVKDARVFAEQFGPESPEPPTWTDNHIIDYFQDQWDEAWSEISGQNAARVKDARVFAEQFGPESPEPPTWTDNHIIDYFQDQWDEAWSEISGQNAARVKDARVFAEQFGPESPEPPTWTDNHIIDYFQDQWDEAWSEISGQNAARVKDARVFAEQFGPESPEPPTWTDNHIIDYFQDASKSLNNALGEAVSFFISDAHGADKIPSNESVQKFGPDGHKTPTWTDNHIIDYFQDQWDEAWSEISGQNAARVKDARVFAEQFGPESPEPPTWTDNHIIDYFQDQWDEAWSEISGQNAARVKDARVFAEQFGPESPEPPTWTDNHIIDYFQDQWDEAWSEISGQNAARVKDARVFAEQFGPESPEPPTWTDNHIIDYFQDQWDEAWSEISGQNAARVKDARVFAEQFGPESPEPPTWTDNHIIDYFQDQWDEAWSEISGQNAARVKDARVFAEQFGPESPEPPTWTDNHIIDYFQDASKSLNNALGEAVSFFISDAHGADKIPSNESVQKFGPDGHKTPTWTDNHIIDYFQDQWDEAWSEISGQNAARVKDARVFAEQFGPESPEPPTWTDNHIIDYFQDQWDEAWSEISGQNAARVKDARVFAEQFGPESPEPPTWTDNHIIDYFQDQWDEAWSEISGQNAARVKDARVFAEQFGPESPEPPTWTDNHIIDYFQDQWDEAWSEISGQNAARVKDARVFAEQFGPESPEPPTWTDNHIIDYFQDASKSLNNALGEAVSFFISDAHGASYIDESSKLDNTIEKSIDSETLSKLDSLHPDLRAVIIAAKDIIDFKVIQGHRGEELQNKYYAEGRSQLQFPQSKHNQAESLAVDIAPLPNLYDSTQEEWDAVAAVVKDIAAFQGVNITHGGDWPDLQDHAHFEIDISKNLDKIATRIPEMPKTESLNKLDESIKKGTEYVELFSAVVKPAKIQLYDTFDAKSTDSGINDYFSDTMGLVRTGLGEAVSFVISDAHGGFDVIDAKIAEVAEKGSSSFAALGKSIQKSTSYATLPSSLINPEIEEFLNDIGKIPKVAKKGSSSFAALGKSIQKSTSYAILQIAEKGSSAFAALGKSIQKSTDYATLPSSLINQEIEEFFDDIAKIPKVAKKGSSSFEALGKSIQESTSYATLPSSLINPEIEEFFNDIAKIPEVSKKGSSSFAALGKSIQESTSYATLPSSLINPEIEEFFNDIAKIPEVSKISEGNKAIASFFGGVSDFFQKTKDSVAALVFSTNSDTKKILSDTESLIISDAHSAPSITPVPNPHSYLRQSAPSLTPTTNPHSYLTQSAPSITTAPNSITPVPNPHSYLTQSAPSITPATNPHSYLTQIQSTAVNASTAFNALGNTIQNVANDGSSSFDKLGGAIKSASAVKYSKEDIRALTGGFQNDSFLTKLWQIAANWLPGMVNDPPRDGQFAIQDMLNLGRSMTEEELGLLNRDLTKHEFFLQNRYKQAENQIEWENLIAKHDGSLWAARLEEVVRWFASDEEIKMADQLAEKRIIEMNHAKANYDPNNLAREPTYIKKLVARQNAADAASEEGFAYNELVGNKQLELAVMRMDPMRQKLEIAAYEAISEAREKKTALDGIDGEKRTKKIRDLAYEKVWQEMANEANSNFQTPEKTRDARFHETNQMHLQGMISDRVRDATIAKHEKAYQGTAFVHNIKDLEKQRELIKGPGYVSQRYNQKQQFYDNAVDKGFVHPKRKEFVDESLYNFDLSNARKLRDTVKTEAEKFNEAAAEYKLYFDQGQFDDNAQTNLDIYTKLLKKLAQGTNSLTDAQKKNFNASVDRAAQGGDPGTGLALPKIENNALKRLEELSQEEKLLSNLNKHEKDIKKQTDDYIKKAVSAGRDFVPGDREGIRKQTDSDYYRRAGDEASEEYKSPAQKLADDIEYYNRLAAESDKYTDTMRDKAIAKLQEDSIGGYIDKLRKENEAIGNNTLAHRVNQASIEAVKTAKDKHSGMSSSDLAEVGRLAREGVYKTEGESVTGEYLTDTQKINEELARLNELRNANVISEETFRSAAMETYDQYSLVLGNIDSARSKIYGAIENSSAQLTDALVEGTQTGKLSFASFTDAIIRDMLRIAIQASITTPLMNALYGFIGGFGYTGTTLPASGGPTVDYSNYAKDGGFVTAQGFADGGGVDLSNLDKMGHVRGPGGSREDKILARLSNGEFVVNAEATRRYRGVLEEINSNAYASGGHVGKGASAGNYQSKGDAPNVNINVYNEAPGTEAEATAEPDGEGGIDVSVMVRQITNQIAADTAKGKGLAPVMQQRYKLNPAAGMR